MLCIPLILSTDMNWDWTQFLIRFCTGDFNRYWTKLFIYDFKVYSSSVDWSVLLKDPLRLLAWNIRLEWDFTFLLHLRGCFVPLLFLFFLFVCDVDFFHSSIRWLITLWKFQFRTALRFLDNTVNTVLILYYLNWLALYLWFSL